MNIVTLTLNPAFDLHCFAEHFQPFHENLARITALDAGGKGVNISRALTVNGVELLLDEIVYNLADNAIKYNRPGGEVVITTARIDGRIALQVRDTGIGIPEAHRGRVFERFYRVDKSHSKEVGGTGLGLSIVKHAAAYHDADVTIDSTEDEGTTVTVRFPI